MKHNLQPLLWMRENREQLDVSVRQHLIDKLQFLRKVPCFIQRFVAKWFYHFVRVPVILEFEQSVSAQSQSVVSELRMQKVAVEQQFTHFPGCATRLTLRKLNSIIKHNGIGKIYLNRKITALLDHATPTVHSPRLWNNEATGKDIGIAIVDTGVAPHTDLTQPTNRIVAFKDFVHHETEPYDDNGHGTHCAGDAAGNGNASNGTYRGPAYEANIIGVKVMDRRGSGQLSDLIAGVDWCILNRNQYNIRVLSLSLGSPASGKVDNDPLARIVRQAWANGLVVVAAAGNTGPESGTISSPGVVPEILTVGASTDQNTVDRSDDEVANFSSRGPTPEGITKPDVVAPGTDIASLRVKGSFLDKMNGENTIDDNYMNLSGTSMATPIVAGIAAQLLQKDTTLTPNDVKTAITTTAESLGNEPNAEGNGLVDAAAAYDFIMKR